MDKARIAVIGGGVSGIAAAYHLREHGHDVVLIERGSRLGGRVGSAELDGWSVDLGGKNIGRNYRLFRAFAAAMGRTRYEYFGLNSSRVEGGRILTMDASTRLRGFARFMARCPPTDVARFAALLARIKLRPENKFLGAPYFDALGAAKDHAPLAAHFSSAFCERVLRPLVVRTNGAEPDEAYLGTLNSNLGMLLDTYEQLEGGMAPLLARFAASVSARLDTTVEGLVFDRSAVRAVRVRSATGERDEIPVDGVVLATPAGEAGRLLEPKLPAATELLTTVRYFPVAVVVAKYERNVFTPSMRALVFGPEHPLSNAGAYGVNALNVIRYTFSGRVAREACKNAPPEELLAVAEGLLDRFVPVRAAGRCSYAATSFTQGLCAFVPYHGSFAKKLRWILEIVPNLRLAGDYLRGASIEACFLSGKEAADEIRPMRAPSRRAGASPEVQLDAEMAS